MPYKDKAAAAERNKAYRAANKAAIAEYMKAWQAANKEAIAEYKKAWQAANKEAIAERKKAHVAELQDGYLARLIGIPVADCPPELIELKREQMAVSRMTKQLENIIKEKSNGTE